MRICLRLTERLKDSAILRNQAVDSQKVRAHFSRAFTLVEMLVSIVLLILMVGLFVEIMNQTSLIFRATSKQLDTTAQSRICLDRIGSDISNLVISRGVVPIVIKDIGDSASGKHNDGMAFLTNTRPEDRSATLSASDIRLVIVGYRVIASVNPSFENANVPALNWGDGTLCWTPQAALQVNSNITTALTDAATDLTGNGSTEKMLAFQPISQAILRFEICFLQDDGTIVLDPPRDINYPTLTGNIYAIALSADTSADPAKRYVKALIIGIAGIDAQTLALVVASGKSLPNLADLLPDPGVNNQTPLQAWDFTSNSLAAQALRKNLTDTFPLPVLNSLRIYQRLYYFDNAQ